MAPDFLVTIDTEADNEWALDATRMYRNIQALPRFQELCDEHGVRPTYLVTYDVAADEASRETLAALALGGNCEIGSHLHAWTTPPEYDLEPGMFRHNPYLHEYPPEIQEQKLANLTRLLTETFGQPRSYRGGRWSLDDPALRLLADSGYVVDTTVTPGISWRANPGYGGGSCGPDFCGQPMTPRMLHDGKHQLLEVPVSVVPDGALGFVSQMPNGVGVVAGGQALGRRLLHKTGLCRMVWLRPGFSSAAQMRWVCDELQRQQAPVLNLMFHSSELIPGGSPRVKTEAAADELWESLNTTFDHVTERLAARPVTLTDYALNWREERVPQQAQAHAGVASHA